MSENAPQSPWIIVLAAGDGRRLATLTRDRTGGVVPKQYCSLCGGRSLLGSTLDRARRLAPRERIVTVVARAHQRWWNREFAGWPDQSVVVQPANRGTAAGILLPLRSILARDPEAVVAVLPSDHFVANEEPFSAALRDAIAAVHAEPGHLVLLGLDAESAATDLGWILPSAARRGTARGVAAFHEKPSPELAAALLSDGALWNSFVFAVRGRTLLAMVQRLLPDLVRRFEEAHAPGFTPADLAALYDELPEADFSRAVLGETTATLRVVSVPPCGWMDLGTPARVSLCIATYGGSAPGVEAAATTPSLATAVSMATARRSEQRNILSLAGGGRPTMRTSRPFGSQARRAPPTASAG
jgi:mannose-1-phosphate guanylyltransferase